ncbi:UNVERIFIED_CONTAM: hypothetical protein PYX00_008352 [Menopon gallinae]|uniref:V-type proton ATPase subunit a n=1 Tax=Menopon gallinae TaxID=328185 RepID=A0AAW2HND2_9NEOP
MGSMFRTEEMALCQLFIQPEAAYSCVSILGEEGVVQFRDLNANVNAFRRKFVGEVRRCDEMERKLRYIEAEVNKDGVKIPECEEAPKAPNPREIIDLEARLEKTENEILELSYNAVNLQSNYLELTELKHVLEKTQVFFTEQEDTSESLTKSLISEENMASQVHRGRLGFVAGVVPRERVPAFERMLWRISRGNVFLRQTTIENPLQDPATRNEIFKTVFVAFFQGEELKARVQKVCSGFHASLYPCPNSIAERQEMLEGVRTRLEDLNLVLNQTEDHRQRVLVSVAKELPNWNIMVRKMKAIYHTLNMFNMDVTKKCLIGECWVPVSDLPVVQNALVDGGKVGGSSIPSFLNVIESLGDPPTYNRTNKFTKGFQNLIDAYGISCYREVNPALYSIITFPFLFAIMFGDAGHGIILTVFATCMILKEKQYMKKKLSSEISSIFFGGRYIILLMGLFSIYTGLIYNDVFSKSLNIFGSSWKVARDDAVLLHEDDLTLDPATDDYTKLPYPAGIDPVWQLATSNKIIFLNSFKLKLSIIFGVVHMIFGVCLGVVNHLYFKRKILIFVEFIPQIIFLSVLFLYLVVLIFLKWSLYSADASFERGTSCAPSILVLFINMMLFKKTTPEASPKELMTKDEDLVGTGQTCDEFMFEGQDILQKFFLAVALLCVPVMLFGKPLYILCQNRRLKGNAKNPDSGQSFELQIPEEGQGSSTAELASHGSSQGSFGEVMILQTIHTIEYVLSTVSHTASYLRLWALSLAHSQLSDVLWSRVMHMGLIDHTYMAAPLLFVIFAIWAFFTITILVMMEGLSAFLHTLRLHWVEFMSKFYTGSGYPFVPFSFKNILEREEADEE